jgi:Uma2 family endonuclease
MNARLPFVVPADPLYPDSDGAPIAENTLQLEWIITILGNLDAIFADRADVFVAGDLLWYPVEGDPTIRRAPDALVAFGRPKGHRGSYRQWLENGVAPQVVFEVLSPGNRAGEMIRKYRFYQRYGVEEYYLWDPDEATLDGWLRQGAELEDVPVMDGWVSPRLGVRFALEAGRLRLYRPDGSLFLTFAELEEQRCQALQRADEADARADEERRRADEERRRADEATLRAERMAAQLRALGLEPDA